MLFLSRLQSHYPGCHTRRSCQISPLDAAFSQWHNIMRSLERQYAGSFTLLTKTVTLAVTYLWSENIGHQHKTANRQSSCNTDFDQWYLHIKPKVAVYSNSNVQSNYAKNMCNVSGSLQLSIQNKNQKLYLKLREQNTIQQQQHANTCDPASTPFE